MQASFKHLRYGASLLSTPWLFGPVYALFQSIISFSRCLRINVQWKKNKEFKESKLLSNDPSATNVKIHVIKHNVLYKTDINDVFTI